MWLTWRTMKYNDRHVAVENDPVAGHVYQFLRWTAVCLCGFLFGLSSRRVSYSFATCGRCFDKTPFPQGSLPWSWRQSLLTSVPQLFCSVINRSNRSPSFSAAPGLISFAFSIRHHLKWGPFTIYCAEWAALRSQKITHFYLYRGWLPENSGSMLELFGLNIVHGQ